MAMGSWRRSKAAARQRLVAGQGELDLGLAAGASCGGPLEIASSRMRHLRALGGLWWRELRGI